MSKILATALIITLHSPLVFADTELTYAGEVFDVLQDNCVECHRPNGVAPMSLSTYAEVAPWLDSIREQVTSRQMPPWHLDRSVGEWANDRTLSEKDYSTLLDWIDNGAIEGDTSNLAAPKSYPEVWQRGEPDLVLRSPQGMQLVSGTETGTLSTFIPTNFTEDRWLKGAEAIPENPDLIHHILVFAAPVEVLNSGDPEKLLASSLTNYSPDRGHYDIHPGEAVLVPAGSVLLVQIHYVKGVDVEAVERPAVGISFADYPVEKRKYIGMVGTTDFLIPAGIESFKTSGEKQLEEDITIDGIFPHMHYRGVEMSFSASTPGEEKMVLMNSPRYDYNWNVFYIPTKPLSLPAGSTLFSDAIYNNSASNRLNPDAEVDVPYGMDIYEEMMYVFFSYTKDNEHLNSYDPSFMP